SDFRVMEKHLGKNWEQTVGFDNSHAGAAETSENLFVRGDLVRPIYKDLPVFFAKDPEAFYRTYERAGWQGYWGAPGKATREFGQDLLENEADGAFRIAEKALAGDDLSTLPVYPANLPASKERDALIEKQLRRYATDAAEIEGWLMQRNLK